MPDLQINVVPTMQLGYGRMGMMIEDALRRLGVDIADGQETAGTLLHCSIPSHLFEWRKGQRLVCLTMWESVTLPEAFRESMHHFDMVIVPSEQNRELFSQYHPNVHVINLGVDPLVWNPTPRTPPTARFNFLHGGSGLRKGGDVAYEAFRMAFPAGSWDGPEPWLTFKSPKHSEFFGDRIMQINGRISAEDEIRLYASSHCYVQPSRGEGFGLQPLQAMVQGLPTILTDAHGHAAFAQYGHPIPASLTPTPRGSFMLGEAGDWWEPDVYAVAERMRWIYDHYNEASVHAFFNATHLVKEFTWDRSAQQILDLIDDLPPYSGSGELVTPTVKRYLTRLNRPHAASIAGTDFCWEAFTDYYEVADVRRILFEGGYLDPTCLEGGIGLTEEQAERALIQSGKASHCGTCHQRLNSQPTHGDLIYAEGERSDHVLAKLQEARTLAETYKPRPYRRRRGALLQEVADVYIKAWKNGEHPTRAVQNTVQGGHNGYSTASAWVKQAREAGLIPPATKGRAGWEEEA